MSLDIDKFIPSVIKQICAGTHTLPNKAREHWEKKHHNVQVLVVSRDETDIREHTGGDMTLDVAEAVTGDVDLFIPSCIIWITNGSDSWKKKYTSRISDRRKGLSERYYPLTVVPRIVIANLWQTISLGRSG